MASPVFLLILNDSFLVIICIFHISVGKRALYFPGKKNLKKTLVLQRKFVCLIGQIYAQRKNPPTRSHANQCMSTDSTFVHTTDTKRHPKHQFSKLSQIAGESIITGYSNYLFSCFLVSPDVDQITVRILISPLCDTSSNHNRVFCHSLSIQIVFMGIYNIRLNTRSTKKKHRRQCVKQVRCEH